MSSKGGSDRVESGGTSKVELPSWLEAPAQRAAGYAENATEDLVYTPWLTEPQLESAKGYVAPVAPGQDYSAAKWNMSSLGTRKTDSSGRTTYGFTPYNAETIAKLQNPWNEQVIDLSLEEMERMREQDRIRQQDASIAASAFGGTGRALEEAELGRNWAEKMAQLESGLRKEGFTQAVGQYNTERDAWMTGLGQETSDRQYEADFDEKQRWADWQREQAILDKAAALRMEPLDLYTKEIAALAGIPYGSTTTTDAWETVAKPNETMMWLGTAANLGATAAKAAPSLALLSDKTKKKDRKDVSSQGEKVLGAFNKLPIENYRYKDQAVQEYGVPQGQRVGPMAQDFAKQFGGDGQTIDMGNALGSLMLAVKALEARTRSLAT